MAAVVTNPSILTVLPLTPSEVEAQKRIDTLNAMDYETQIKPKWGDLKPEYKPTCKDSVWGGNLEHARKAWDLATADRSYHAYKAKSYAVSVFSSMAALPAKIYLYVAHLFKAKSDERTDMLARDVKDIKDGFAFILQGTLYGLGQAALTLLVDPFVMLYRFIDRKLIHPGPRAALLLVDTQYDFFPAKNDVDVDGKPYSVEAGTLAVPGSWDIVPVIRNLQQKIKGVIVGCMDHHPVEHGATAKMLGEPLFKLTKLNDLEQVAWPIHCVQESRGQKYVAGIIMDLISRIFEKGTDMRVDSYSAFYDNGNKNKTLLTEYLKETCGVTDLFVTGVAFDFCVGFSALHAQREGFNTTVIEDATRGTVGNKNKDGVDTNDAMRASLLAEKVKIVNSTDLIDKSPFLPRHLYRHH